jgi:hypothetical protein
MDRTGLPFKTRGSIVNVGSLTSHLAIRQMGPYIMSKHGEWIEGFNSSYSVADKFSRCTRNDKK